VTTSPSLTLRVMNTLSARQKWRCPSRSVFEGATLSDSSSSKKKTYIAAYCKVCNTRVTPKAKFAGRRIKCPDCFTSIQLPTLEEYRQKQKAAKLRAPAQPKEHGAYGLSEPIESPELPQTHILDEHVKIRHVRERPKPPKRPFFSNVFQFPWTEQSTLARWGMIAGGLSINGVIAAFNLWLVEENGIAGAIPVLFLLLAQLSIATWSLSFASSCAFSIIQDTGAGLDKVEGWPEGGVREWMADFMAVVYVFFASGLVCYLIALPLQPLTGMVGLPVVIIHAFLFPPVLLAALDADSIFFPYSEMTLRSFKRIPLKWMQMSVLIFGVWLAVAGALTSILVYSPMIAGAASGPFVAAGIFISARLIGRQACLIGEDASREDEVDDD
jgi:hypothetical protein